MKKCKFLNTLVMIFISFGCFVRADSIMEFKDSKNSKDSIKTQDLQNLNATKSNTQDSIKTDSNKIDSKKTQNIESKAKSASQSPIDTESKAKNIESKTQNATQKTPQSATQSPINIESKPQSTSPKNTESKPKNTESKSPQTQSKKIKNTLPKVANGATFIPITTSKNPKALHLGKKTYKWLPHPVKKGEKIAFVSIGYYAKKGDVTLGNNISINIIEGNYKKEKITIQNKGMVKPNAQNAKRIEQERNEANKIYTTYDKTRYWSEKFGYPLEKVEVSSPFGSARVFNGEIKSAHLGTDMRASEGTSVYAINDGVVMMAKQRFLAGGSVIISHGEGVFSMYYHLSEFKVSVGQRVKKGDLIALSGNTGRSSAPHLHLSMMVNGNVIDPFDFIEGVNKLFE